MKIKLLVLILTSMIALNMYVIGDTITVPVSIKDISVITLFIDMVFYAVILWGLVLYEGD